MSSNNRSSMEPEPSKSDSELPATIDMDQQTVGEAFGSLLSRFQYSAAISEKWRSVRAYASERFRESANWFVPASFRDSQSYSVFVRQMLEYVARDVKPQASSENSSIASTLNQPSSAGGYDKDQVFLARKTVSSLLDMAALGTFHLSPLTVMAIFSEIAYSSNDALQQLGARLKEQRIIPTVTQINSSTELISALETALGDTQDMFDSPLISIQGLRRTVHDTREAIEQVDPIKLLSLAEIDQLFRQMELAARAENASIWDVSATVSVVALNHIQAVGRERLISLDISGNIFQHHIIDHYWEGLRAIERQGLLPALSQASEPFLETLWANYAMDQKTWTEQLFSGELLKWGWSQLAWPKWTGK